jgi:hypothetical protein
MCLQGHEDEVAVVGGSLASYFEVYHRLLATRLAAAARATTAKQLSQIAAEIAESCVGSQHTYVHAQQLLAAAASWPGGDVFRRLGQEVEAAAVAQHGGPKVYQLQVCHVIFDVMMCYTMPRHYWWLIEPRGQRSCCLHSMKWANLYHLQACFVMLSLNQQKTCIRFHLQLLTCMCFCCMMLPCVFLQPLFVPLSATPGERQAVALVSEVLIRSAPSLPGELPQYPGCLDSSPTFSNFIFLLKSHSMLNWLCSMRLLQFH